MFVETVNLKAFTEHDDTISSERQFYARPTNLCLTRLEQTVSSCIVFRLVYRPRQQAWLSCFVLTVFECIVHRIFLNSMSYMPQFGWNSIDKQRPPNASFWEFWVGFVPGGVLFATYAQKGRGFDWLIDWTNVNRNLNWSSYSTPMHTINPIFCTVLA